MNNNIDFAQIAFDILELHMDDRTHINILNILIKNLACDNQSLVKINQRIQTEICKETILKFKDEYLLSIYKNCNSVKNKIAKFEIILNIHIKDNELI